MQCGGREMGLGRRKTGRRRRTRRKIRRRRSRRRRKRRRKESRYDDRGKGKNNGFINYKCTVKTQVCLLILNKTEKKNQQLYVYIYIPIQYL